MVIWLACLALGMVSVAGELLLALFCYGSVASLCLCGAEGLLKLVDILGKVSGVVI